MKTKKNNLIILLLLISAIVFNGCEKGEDGAPGKDGSANVTAYTYSVASWPYASPAYYKNLSTPELTADNLNTASVQVYLSKSSNTWIALPNTFFNSGSSNYFMGFETTVGNVKVTWIYDTSFSSGSDPNTYFGTTCQLKVVIIPPAMIATHPEVDLKNYQEVVKVFNVKE